MSVVQPVVHHGHARAVQRLDRVHQDRVTAMRARSLCPLRRRERQMVARCTADYVERADPIEQSEVDRCSSGSRQNGDDSDGENLFNGHARRPPTTLGVWF